MSSDLSPLERAFNLAARLVVGRHRFPLPSPAHPTETMRAVAYSRHGGPEVLEVRDDHPRPVPAQGQLLIRVAGAGVNPVDFKLRAHPLSDMIIPKPKIPGADVSGEVVCHRAAPGCGFDVGDEVIALAPMLTTPWGSCAEYLAVDAGLCAPAPRGVPLSDAATLPLVGLTVMQGLDPVTRRGALEGKRILVHGGGGGVGSFAVQYAKHVLGMHVSATCSSRKADWVRALGADEIIDYRAQSFEDVSEPQDVVLDPFAHVHSMRSRALLRRGGSYVHIAGSTAEITPGAGVPETRPRPILTGLGREMWHGKRHYNFVFVYPDGARLRRLVEHVEAGAIRPVVERRRGLEGVAEAHQTLAEGHMRGKFLIEPRY